MSRVALLILAIGLLALPGAARAQPAAWSTGTAYTLPEGRWEVGLFQPWRIGLSDTLEMSTHPLLDLLMPNMALKKAWRGIGGGQLATRHNLVYPTGLLTALARDGTGGVLPGDTRVPHIVALTNEALYSRAVIGEHLVTGKLGLVLAARFGESNLPTIDLPVVFPRTAAYHNTATFNVGVDIDGPIWGPLLYTLDADLFAMPDEAWLAFEQSGMLTWQATRGFAVQVGYKVVYGQYPFGSQWHLLPLFDLQWAFD